MKPPVIQIRQEMSDSISNPNLLTGYGWKKKRKAAEKGNLPEGCLWSQNLGVPAEFDMCVFSRRLA